MRNGVLNDDRPIVNNLGCKPRLTLLAYQSEDNDVEGGERVVGIEAFAFDELHQGPETVINARRHLEINRFLNRNHKYIRNCNTNSGI